MLIFGLTLFALPIVSLSANAISDQGRTDNLIARGGDHGGGGGGHGGGGGGHGGDWHGGGGHGGDWHGGGGHGGDWGDHNNWGHDNWGHGYDNWNNGYWNGSGWYGGSTYISPGIDVNLGTNPYYTDYYYYNYPYGY